MVEKVRRLAAAVTTAWAFFVVAAAGQTVTSLLPTPDQPTAPIYSQAVPNGGAPLAAVGAITGFGRTFGFGSNATNTSRADPGVNSGPPSATAGARTEVNSNGHALYIELFSPLVGH